MKKGRHRRFEEARALKRNQDLDLDNIFDSLEIDGASADDSGYSPAYDAWAEEFGADYADDAEHAEHAEDAATPASDTAG